MPKPRHFTFDVFGGPDPVVGQLMIGPRARYRVTEARPVDSKVWHNRWKLTCERVADDTPVTEPWSEFSSYDKGETPQDLARRIGYVESANA